MARTRGVPLALADVEALRATALRVGEDARRAKAALLHAYSMRGVDRPRILAEYHDALLFVAAYADDAGIAEQVEGELRRVAAAARWLARGASLRAEVLGRVGEGPGQEIPDDLVFTSCLNGDPLLRLTFEG